MVSRMDIPEGLLKAYGALLNPQRLTPLGDALGGAPAERGVYALYFTDAPLPPEKLAACWQHPRPPSALAYIGSSGDLRERLRKHLRGYAHSSIVRKKLGQLFQYPLHRDPDRKHPTFGQKEAELSEWIEAHVLVAWMEHDDGKAAEATLIEVLQPPLNERTRPGAGKRRLPRTLKRSTDDFGDRFPGVPCHTLVFSGHAVQRMYQRGVTGSDVRGVIATGEVIASCPDDRPYPTGLLLGFRAAGPLHVVIALDRDAATCHVVTV